MNDLTERDLGWLAGILEGEGCFSISQTGTVQVRVAMTDEDVVRRCQAVTGIGVILQQRQQQRQQMWRWSVNRARDVIDLLALVRPLMGQRRQTKIAECLEAAKRVGTRHGEETHCPKGHPYAGSNLIIEGTGRRCRTCKRARAYYRKSHA
jgi:hypothetical protein